MSFDNSPDTLCPVLVFDTVTDTVFELNLGFLPVGHTTCQNLLDMALCELSLGEGIVSTLYKGDFECPDLSLTLNHYDIDPSHWVVQIFRKVRISVCLDAHHDEPPTPSHPVERTFTVSENISTADLTQMISKELQGCPQPRNMRLICRSLNLTDETTLLHLCDPDIVGEAAACGGSAEEFDFEISVIDRLRGGGTDFVDVSKEPTPVRFSETAPDWRVAHPGLNLEGVCRNARCRANGKRVVVPLGVKTDYHFILDSHLSRCPLPLCRNFVTPEVVAFTDCEYAIRYVKTPVCVDPGDPPKQPVKETTGWRIVDPDIYLVYSPERLQTAEFEYVKIYVRPFNGVTRERVGAVDVARGQQTQNTVCFRCGRRLQSPQGDFRCEAAGHGLHHHCNEALMKAQHRRVTPDACGFCPRCH